MNTYLSLFKFKYFQRKIIKENSEENIFEQEFYFLNLYFLYTTLKLEILEKAKHIKKNLFK